jgi:sensor histidine kinase YesM
MQDHLKISFQRLQLLVWVIFFFIWLLYVGSKWDDPKLAFINTLTNFITYIIAVYMNSHWLMPAYFKKGKILFYFLYALSSLSILMFTRLYIEKALLYSNHKTFYNMGMPHFSHVMLTTLVAFLIGGFLFVLKRYVLLLKQQEEMKTLQATTELNLLKQQVQPHFLFNTLNNIYALAHSKSDSTTVAIEKLASIMRYFIEDAPKEKVDLQTEIKFIENYISLEQLRMVHPLQLHLQWPQSHVEIPPMLLMPFVENLFKHGIDKTRPDNVASLQLYINDGKLNFTVSNSIFTNANNGHGFGLRNLQQRLSILYNEAYTCSTQKMDDTFIAKLTIPV